MIIATCTWRGLGATTAALMLAASAAARGETAWVVEADPAGGVLAGRVPDLFQRPPSLVRIAFDEVVASPSEAQNFAHDVGGFGVFTQSPNPFEAWAAIENPRLRWLDAVSRLDGLVIFDVGSLRGVTPVWPIIRRADCVLVVTTPDPATMVASADWVADGTRSNPHSLNIDTRPWSMLVVDSPAVGREVYASVVQSDLGVPVAGWWPWDPATVDTVLRGADLHHRRRGRLPAAVDLTLETLTGIGVPA